MTDQDNGTESYQSDPEAPSAVPKGLAPHVALGKAVAELKKLEKRLEALVTKEQALAVKVEAVKVEKAAVLEAKRLAAEAKAAALRLFQ